MNRKQSDLFRLISVRHDGRELSDEELNELALLLEDDPDAQLVYFQMERMFHDLENSFVGNCAETLVQEFSVRKRKTIPFVGWCLGIAASLLVAFLMVPGSGKVDTNQLVDEEATILFSDESPFVARVISSEGMVWGEDNSVEISEGQLQPGLLDLKEGRLDMMFENGTRLVFVAPVKMDLASFQRLSLHSGKLLIDVPGVADGLVINTPDAVLKTYAAYAQIEAEAHVPTLVYVERGTVNLFTENQIGEEIRRTVARNETFEIAQGTVDPVLKTRRVIEPHIDVAKLPELADLKYVHYRFDDTGDGNVKNHGTVPAGDGWLEGISAHPEYPRPRAVTGRFKRALEFSGHGEGMIAHAKEFGNDEPGSVAFWIKLDPDTQPGKFENIMTWHMFTKPEKEWHEADQKELACRIRINDAPENGVVGAVKIEFRNIWICGSSDLRDGRWHHITAVFHRTYAKKAIVHYIDGRLARPSAKGKTWFSRERYKHIGGGTISVGRSYWPNRPESLSDDEPFGLQGCLDELYVFNQPVLPTYIPRLLENNEQNRPQISSYAPWAQWSIAMLSHPSDLGKKHRFKP